MYKRLPPGAREKVLTNKKLVDISMISGGVKVTCTDGSTFEGSIVIGADGVQSKTRQLMRRLALETDPTRSWDLEQPYTATYQLLYGSFPSPSPSGSGYDIQAKGKSIMYFSGPNRGWFFLYKRLPKPTRERTNYSDTDVDSVAREFLEFPLTRTVKVKDVWPRMLGAGLTNLEEGIVQHWSLGRIVLVGDACHKMTTHLGLGFNNGIQDVVVLCNNLREAMNAAAPNETPSAAALTETFEKYKAVRMSSECSLKDDVWMSGFETRMHAWHNKCYYILSRYLVLLPWTESFVMRYVMTPQFRKGQVLDYVLREEPMKGMVSWLYPMKA
jgi:2-polyprenyl-6-methoxyphenol hydroxylase-like FAD-dependent oxidoreductase